MNGPINEHDFESPISIEHVINRGRIPPLTTDFKIHDSWVEKLNDLPIRWLLASILSEAQIDSHKTIHDQSRLPLLIAKADVCTSNLNMPVVLVFHATSGSKSSPAVTEVLARYAAKGWVAVSMDNRYHGRRSGHAWFDESPSNESSGAWERDVPTEVRLQKYNEALVAAWRGSGEQPFIYDSVWDARRVVDWLSAEGHAVVGADPARIGATGISLGGMIAWIAAASDPRITVAAPAIGVQAREHQGQREHLCLSS
jgi:dienelactone hydrolase